MTKYKNFFNYLIYNDGRVYSLYINRYLKPYIDKNGYKKIKLSINGCSNTFAIHRLVGLLFIDNPNNKPQINHIDGNKNNNSYSNLEWCTAYENNLHARTTGLNNISKSNSNRWQNPEFAIRTKNRMKKVCKEKGLNKGEKNPRFKYIIFHNKEKINIEQLSEIIGYSISYTRSLVANYVKEKYHQSLIDNNINIIIKK